MFTKSIRITNHHQNPFTIKKWMGTKLKPSDRLLTCLTVRLLFSFEKTSKKGGLMLEPRGQSPMKRFVGSPSFFGPAKCLKIRIFTNRTRSGNVPMHLLCNTVPKVLKAHTTLNRNGHAHGLHFKRFTIDLPVQARILSTASIHSIWNLNLRPFLSDSARVAESLRVTRHKLMFIGLFFKRWESSLVLITSNSWPQRLDHLTANHEPLPFSPL